MRMINFAKRNFKELIRDPLGLVFEIALPLFLLFIFQQFNIPAENYRLENASNLPSRLHSLYVTTEEGLSYWCNLLIDNDLEVFKVDVANEPFVTNEQFLPSEELTYQESYNLSKNYWYPKFNKQNIDTASNEYLVQGRVRILKKVDEIKKK